MGLVEGKTALIVGGASGIGRATAKLLTKEGAKIAIADLNIDAAKLAASEISPECFYIQVDVTDPTQVSNMVSSVTEHFGRLDCAVNTAGISESPELFGDVKNEIWNANININLNGLRSCMKHEIEAMRQSGGSIVNLASAAGLKGVPGRGSYVAAKHGVVGATKVAAIDHAKDGIRVNVLCPGLIRTPMTQQNIEDGEFELGQLCPMARIGEPHEVAEVAVWLCSDRSSFITGAAIPVDGGDAAW